MRRLARLLLTCHLAFACLPVVAADAPPAEYGALAFRSIGPAIGGLIVASAGADAGVDGYILERLGGAPDHPMTLEFPEGEYLKGLVVMRKP